MTLKLFAEALTTGKIINWANALLTLVHSVIDELDDIRGHHDSSETAVTEMVNRLEDRSNANLAAVREDLAAKLNALFTRLDKLEAVPHPKE